MDLHRSHPIALSPPAQAFYRHALVTLRDSNVSFLVGGSYALEAYTEIERPSKDLDVFVQPADCAAALAVLAGAGYATEVVFPHWLAKVYSDEDYLDVIFGSGNGVCAVDSSWFEYATPAEVLGVPVNL